MDTLKKALNTVVAKRQLAWNYYTIGMFLPNPDPVLKKMNKDIAVYKELKTDPHVWSQIQKRKNGILAREWRLDRNGAPARGFRVVEALFQDLDIYDLIDNVLDCVQYGYQPVELIYEKAGGMMLPTQIVAKPPDWFCFSENNELLFRTKTAWHGEPVPARKFLSPSFCGSYENPYGEPTLARCFWPVTFKKGGLRFWTTFLEKYGIPWPIGKLPRNRKPEEFEDLKDKLENMVQDGVAVIPDDGAVEMLGSSGKSEGSQGFERQIMLCNSEISKAQIGSTLTTEIGDTGSYAAAETHLEATSDFYAADKKIVENFFNQVIKLIFEINFDAHVYPKFHIHEEDDSRTALADRDAKLPLKFTPEYYQDKYGLDPKYFELKSEPTTMPTAGTAGIAQPPETPPNAEAPLPDTRPDDDDGPDTYTVANPQLGAPTATEYQALAEGLLAPVIDLIAKGSSFEQIMTSLSAAWPAMDVSQLTEMITRARFVAHMAAALDVQNENQGDPQ